MKIDLSKKLLVMTVVGTRPEIIKLSRIISKLDESCEHVLVHTGQNYDFELSQIFFDDLGIRKPDYFLNTAAPSASEMIGQTLISIDKLFSQLLPDALLVLGDTNSCLCVIAAKRHKIPIFHLEAGNRCFDMRVPEEINRKIVDHTSDVNMTYSDIARTCLLNEGLRPDLVIKVGSPMMEVLRYYEAKIEKSDVLTRLAISKGGFFLISSHREENVDSDIKFKNLCDLINDLAERYGCPVIFSGHPRTRKRIDQAGRKFNDNVKVLKPLCFSDYCKLQISSKAVISDSGTITEEASILQFPALNIREAQERHEGMEEAAVMMVGLNQQRVIQALDVLDKQSLDRVIPDPIVQDYIALNVSDKVVRIIISYVDFVNRVVWSKV